MSVYVDSLVDWLIDQLKKMEFWITWTGPWDNSINPPPLQSVAPSALRRISRQNNIVFNGHRLPAAGSGGIEVTMTQLITVRLLVAIVVLANYFWRSNGNKTSIMALGVNRILISAAIWVPPASGGVREIVGLPSIWLEVLTLTLTFLAPPCHCQALH